MPITIPSFNVPSLTLDGKKTYGAALALIALSVAHSMGYIPTNLYDILLPILGGGGLAALRAGVKKSSLEPQATKQLAAEMAPVLVRQIIPGVTNQIMGNLQKVFQLPNMTLPCSKTGEDTSKEEAVG